MAIRVDAETLHSKAKELQNLRSTHDENIAKMRSLINGMSDAFEGAAATAYVNRFASMESTLTSFSEMIGEFATALDSVATSFTEEDNSLANSLNG
jgi:WXG100 family type VII secretion target